MAYTNAWTDTIPLGSEAASHIDDFMRQTRLDVHERMNSLVVDWTADPVVLKPGSTGDITRFIPFSCFLNDLHAKENDIALGSIHAFQGNGPYVAGISAFLPFNTTITRIIGWIDRDAAHTVTMTLYQIPFSTGGASSPAIVNNGANIQYSTTTGSNQAIDSGALSPTVAFNAANMYTLTFDASGGSSGDAYEIYGVQINFTLH